MTTLAAGAALLIAVLLVAAGVGKLAAPAHVAAAMHRIVSDGIRGRQPFGRFVVAGRVLGAVEVGLGTALLTGWAVIPVRLATALLCIGFVWVVAVAVRKGASCGCFASFSDGAAAGAELARALVLGTLAMVALVDAGRSEPADPIAGRAVPVGLALLVLLGAATVVGGRMLPARSAGTPGVAAAWASVLTGAVRSRRIRAGVVSGVDVLTGRARAEVVEHVRADPGVDDVVREFAAAGRTLRWSKAGVQRASNQAGERMTTVEVPARPDGALRAMVVERPGHAARIVTTAAVDVPVSPVRASPLPERPASPP